MKKIEQGTLLNFSLFGGRLDGGLVVYPLMAPGDVYLVSMVREEDPAVRDVWAYSFANRTDAAGNWVLQHERYIGCQGVPGLLENKETGGQG
jgi:hypothetical protein